MALLLAPALGSAADFVGVDTCRTCHPGAYEAWKTHSHSRALSSLPQKQQNDPRCTTCHAPEREKGLTAVSCESCHGAGQLYSPAYVMRDRELAHAVGLAAPDDKTCQGCHTDSAPSLTKFEYPRKLKLIEHWEADRAARLAKRPAEPTTPPPATPARPTRSPR